LRQLATICALAVISAALIFAQVSASGGTAQNPLVVADHIAARELAMNPIESRTAMYLTNAGSPNRIFALHPTTRDSNALAAARRTLAAFAGTGTAGSLGDGGVAAAAQFDLSPDSLVARSGIAVAPDGTIYIADTQNSTIRTVAAATSAEPDVIRSVAGRWAPIGNIALIEPLGIALDRAGNLYIADHAAGAVDVFSAATRQIEVLAHVISPASIAVAPDGSKVFVASPETGAVFAIHTQTRAMEVVPGFAAPITSAASSEPSSSATAGVVPSASSACAGRKSDAATSGSNRRMCPAGLAVDGGANLFIADANSGQILRIDAQTNNPTVAGEGLSMPGALAFNVAGDLFVAEQGRNRIVEFEQVGLAPSSIALSPASAGFISEPVGGVSPTTGFTLANNSASAVNAVSISIAGATPADFTVVSTNCTATLNASSTCTISVAYAPQAAGSRSATLTVKDANANDLATANLYSLGLSPTSATYTAEPVSGTTAAQQFILANNAPGVTITGLAVGVGGVNPGDFTVQGKSCTATLAASSSCTINVAFTPQNTGPRAATLNITEPGGAATSATLSGTGDDFEVQLASGQTSEVSVIAGTTATFNSRVVPIGSFGAHGESISFLCPTNLPAKTTCSFSPNSVNVTPGTPAPFKLKFVTTNRLGITVAAGPPGVLPGGGRNSPREPSSLLPRAHELPQLARAPLFPALGALALLAVALAFRNRGGRQMPLFAFVLLVAAVLGGCHKKSKTSTLGTPTGTYVMTIVGNAVDAHGHPLNVSRSLTITLDVTM
jgi:sugar lactone lactonase YvrE